MHQSDGAAFDVVLLLHAGCAVVGIVTMLTAAATAGRLRRTLERRGELSEALGQYFRAGFNWAGRTIYGIPLFGFALVALSDGSDALGDGWVLAGLGLFAGVALLGEAAVWPAERRIGSVLAASGPVPHRADEDGSVGRDARLMARGAGTALVLLIAGTVVMVAQP